MLDACCCLTRLFNRSERELRSCKCEEREGHPSFTSSYRASQVRRNDQLIPRLAEGTTDYSPRILLPVSQRIPTWTPCHWHNPFSLRTFQHFLVLLTRETFFLASTHNQNNPMLIQSLFSTHLHLLCLLLLQDAQQNLRQNAQFIRLTVTALPTQLP
jgi:hypothetical protein